MNARNRRKFHEQMHVARHALRRARIQLAVNDLLSPPFVPNEDMRWRSPFDERVLNLVLEAAYARSRARYYLGVKNP